MFRKLLEKKIMPPLLLNEIDNFLDYILFSDEARFSNNGAANRHNCHL
jgi:hypothetical protein